MVLEMSKDWYYPPWKIEEECSEEWVQRWAAWHRAIDKAKRTIVKQAGG